MCFDSFYGKPTLSVKIIVFHLHRSVVLFFEANYKAAARFLMPLFQRRIVFSNFRRNLQWKAFMMLLMQKPTKEFSLRKCWFLKNGPVADLSSVPSESLLIYFCTFSFLFFIFSFNHIFDCLCYLGIIHWIEKFQFAR